ncbi:MAG: efflux RND transporter periplasmic adaptor subunit [Sphingobacteriaceae bacterium]|jgi:RND family efflux transporter MFP subunit
MKKLLLLPFVGGLILITTSCGSENTNSDTPDVFPTTVVIKKDTSVYTEYVAEIHAIQNVEIHARVSGYLDKTHIDEGAEVKEGQHLFSINNKEYIEELSKAKAVLKSTIAEVKAAEIELANVTQLADKKIVSISELELAKNKLDAQKALMEEAIAHQSFAQLRLSNTEIKAPFNGFINRIPHKNGSLINEGTLLTTISNNSEIHAYFDVSEKEYLSYARSSRSDSGLWNGVSLILADGTEHLYKGKIETIESIVDHNTGNIAFRAKFPNPDKILKHGASGKIRLLKKYANVLLIPQKSTFEIQDKTYVYVLDTTNTVKSRNIEIMQRLPHLYLVRSGLKEGERIIYEGIQTVKPDTKIQPKEVRLHEILKQLSIH